MKASLKLKETTIYYVKDGVRVEGVHANLSGDVSNLSGYVFNLSGDVSNLRGDVSNLSGDVTGVKGDVTQVIGNLDDCELTEEDRKNGVDVSVLLG